jgi:hypothetical protein
MSLVPPTWVELVDAVDVDRTVFYSPSQDRCQWEPRPDGVVEPWDDEKHAPWRILASASVAAGRSARAIKLTMAGKYYERAEWAKAAVEFHKAVACGCGRHPEAMLDFAHVQYESARQLSTHIRQAFLSL